MHTGHVAKEIVLLRKRNRDTEKEREERADWVIKDASNMKHIKYVYVEIFVMYFVVLDLVWWLMLYF